MMKPKYTVFSLATLLNLVFLGNLIGGEFRCVDLSRTSSNEERDASQQTCDSQLHCRISEVIKKLIIDINKYEICYNVNRNKPKLYTTSKYTPNTYTHYLISNDSITLPEIANGSNVLDVGTGLGEISSRLLQATLLAKGTFTGIEPADKQFKKSAKRLTDCKIEGSSADASSLDSAHVPCRLVHKTLQQFAEDSSEHNKYDLITIFKVSIPLNEEESFSQALFKLLKPGGEVFITSDGIKMHPSSEENLLFHLKQAGFLKKDYAVVYYNNTIPDYRQTILTKY